MLQKIIRVEDVGCGMKKMDENGKIRGYPESDSGFYGISYDWLVCGTGEMRQEVDEGLIS